MSQCYRQLRLDEREALFRMQDVRLPVSQALSKPSCITTLRYCGLVLIQINDRFGVTQ